MPLTMNYELPKLSFLKDSEEKNLRWFQAMINPSSKSPRKSWKLRPACEPPLELPQVGFFKEMEKNIDTLEFAELKARVVGDPVIVWDKGNETLNNTSNKYAVSRNSEDFFTKHIADAQRRRRVHPSRSGSCAV